MTKYYCDLFAYFAAGEDSGSATNGPPSRAF